jgi:hypothetical protein
MRNGWLHTLISLPPSKSSSNVDHKHKKEQDRQLPVFFWYYAIKGSFIPAHYVAVLHFMKQLPPLFTFFDPIEDVPSLYCSI